MIPQVPMEEYEDLPTLVVCISPQAGHYIPMLRIVRWLDHRGYPMLVLGPENIKETCMALQSVHGFIVVISPISIDSRRTAVMSLPRGIERWYWAVEHAFLDAMPLRHTQVVEALNIVAGIRADNWTRVQIIQEACFLGTLPFVFGAPLPAPYKRLPRVINISVIPYPVASVNTAPFGMARLPAVNAQEQDEFRRMYEEQKQPRHPMAKLTTRCNTLLRAAGATRDLDMNLFDSWYNPWDATVMLCCPEMEYPRVNRQRNLMYAGCLPAGPVPEEVVPWLQRLKHKLATDPLKLVVVTQGSLALNYEELIIPTLHAVKDMENVTAIALLGKPGVTLPMVVMPENTQCVDTFPYDMLLPLAHCWVTNGGYGSFTSCAVHGVPMVVAGDDEDKPEVAQRVAWSGMGINLGTGRPTVEKVKRAIEEVLGDDSYKQVAMGMKLRNESLDAFEFVEGEIRFNDPLIKPQMKPN